MNRRGGASPRVPPLFPGGGCERGAGGRNRPPRSLARSGSAAPPSRLPPLGSSVPPRSTDSAGHPVSGSLSLWVPGSLGNRKGLPPIRLPSVRNRSIRGGEKRPSVQLRPRPERHGSPPRRPPSLNSVPDPFERGRFRRFEVSPAGMAFVWEFIRFSSGRIPVGPDSLRDFDPRPSETLARLTLTPHA